MRAAVVIHTPRSPHSAIVTAYEGLARALAAGGHALEILGPADLGADRVGARLLPLVLPFLVRRRLRRRRDLDVVIFHSYAGWMGGARPGVKTVVDFHGFEPLFHEAQRAEARRAGRPLSRRFRFFYGTLMPRMLRVSCRRAALVTCLSRAERDALVERGYAPASRIWLKRFGSPALFAAPHAYRARATTLLAVMQWLPTKGTRYLVDAFTTLARRHPDLRLHVAGALRAEPDVRADFPADVRGRVTVRPFFERSEQAAIFAAADIFVHTSLYEAFGMAILEAMASGMPVVTTRTGVGADYLEHGREGLVVPVADAAAVAAAIEPLLDDRGRREALGTAGRRRAEALTDADASAAYAARLVHLAEAGRCA